MPATPPVIPYDVFISYSHADSDWVFEWLVPRLKDVELRVCTDRESFELGVPALINMENAVAASRHTLLVLTPAYLASNWTIYEQILTQTQDPIGLRQRTIPVLRQPCDLPMRIAMLTYADLTGKRDEEAELAKIVRALGGMPRPPQADQPKAPPPPAPLPPNPFAGVNTIGDAAHFIGREAELRRLKILLQVGSVALLGEPQIGMSSLLGQIARTWLGTVIGPLNCQELDSRNDFYEYLAGKLGLSGYAWPPIREKLKASELLFLVDELDAGPAHGIKLEDLGRFRAVASANHGFRMVIVSHHSLRHVFPNTGPDSPGYSFLQPLTIGVLNDADARKLLEHPWAPDVPQFEPAIRDDLLKLTGGHPFKLHRAAFHRYETLIDPTYDWLAAYRQDLENLL
jgi:hypothetical protein